MPAVDEDQGHARARALGELATQQNLWVVTVESCTGGLLAGALTSVPGSSAWFDRGWVTYSNQAKHAMVGVDKQTLRDHGAVSEAVAKAMAIGALNHAQTAGLALATTGIAGPGGGTPDKPVGLVWFGFAIRTAQGILTATQHQVFQGGRASVREASVAFAIERAIELLSRSGGGTR